MKDLVGSEAILLRQGSSGKSWGIISNTSTVGGLVEIAEVVASLEGVTLEETYSVAEEVICSGTIAPRLLVGLMAQDLISLKTKSSPF
jgi:hypothetical protein